MNAQIESVEGEIIQATRNELVKLHPYAEQLAEFKEVYGGAIYDLDNEEQNKQARADRLAIGKVIASLDRKHSELKAPLLEATRLFDGRRKEIKDELLDLQDGIKQQFAAHDLKEKQRLADHCYRIQIITARAEAVSDRSLCADDIAKIIAATNALEIDETYEEFIPDAEIAKANTLETLKVFHNERVLYEREQAELEVLRAEKEDRERRDLNAKLISDAAEKVREEERAKAEREIAAANKRAQEAIQEERARAARVEEQRLAEEAKITKRTQARAYREKVHAKAQASLESEFDWLFEDGAKQLVNAIAEGRFPHIQIKY